MALNCCSLQPTKVCWKHKLPHSYQLPSSTMRKCSGCIRSDYANHFQMYIGYTWSPGFLGMVASVQQWILLGEWPGYKPKQTSGPYPHSRNKPKQFNLACQTVSQWDPMKLWSSWYCVNLWYLCNKQVGIYPSLVSAGWGKNSLVPWWWRWQLWRPSLSWWQSLGCWDGRPSLSWFRRRQSLGWGRLSSPSPQLRASHCAW